MTSEPPGARSVSPRAETPAAASGAQVVAPGFAADAGNFSRTTTLSYAYADIAPSLLWIVGLLWLTPTWTVFLPGLVTGIAAILIDYVWFYRNGRREVVLDRGTIGPWFIALWLIGWFEFLIAFNMGTYLGLMLQVGLRTQAGALGTALYLGWFWILTPILARALSDMGIGRALVTTTRRVGGKLSWGRLGMVVLLHALLYGTVLAPDWPRALELFAVGTIVAAGMEVPLYLLRIRPGRDAWKALVLNTLVEWNYAVPILFFVLRAMGELR